MLRIVNPSGPPAVAEGSRQSCHVRSCVSLLSLRRCSQVLSKHSAQSGVVAVPRRSRHGRMAARAALAAPPTEQLDVTKMAPLGDRVLVKPAEPAKVKMCDTARKLFDVSRILPFPRSFFTSTAGGILLATTGTESLDEAQFGVVLAVGEDVEAGVKVGDTILFQKYSTSEVTTPEGKIIFVAEKSILATLS